MQLLNLVMILLLLQFVLVLNLLFSIQEYWEGLKFDISGLYFLVEPNLLLVSICLDVEI